MSTITNILSVLGMLDERTLVFPDDTARYDPNHMVVRFKGKDGTKIVPCAISREALEDHFNGDDKELVKVFQANRERIKHEARRKYLDGRMEADGSVLIKTDDL